MVKTATPSRRILVVGANHRSSSMGLRDRLFVEDADVAKILGSLGDAGIAEALVLATCDRIEVTAAVDDTASGEAAIKGVLAGHGGLDAVDLDGQLYTFTDEPAISHLFGVAASLDSQVVGEPQVLGQVKAGHRLAREAGMIGVTMEPMLQAAYGSAKRVRTETAISEGPVSIAAAAVELAKDLHGPLDGVNGLLIGVGEMGELIAGQLIAGGLGRMTVMHPTPGRADPVARALDCHHAPFDSLAEAMVTADVVLCALGRRQHALSADMVRAALRSRHNRPVFVVDVAVPGDVEPAVNRIDEAFLYDLADLERITMEGRSNRERETGAARKIVAEDVAAFMRQRTERAAVPALRQLRGHVEVIREDSLAKAGDDAAEATRLLVNRLLHEPSERLRHAAIDGSLENMEAVVRTLFDLGSGYDDNDEDGKEET